MARQVIVNQSTREEKVYPLDFSPALLEGVSVVSVTIEYSGDNPDDDPPVTDDLVEGNIAYISVSDLIVGKHVVSVVATTDDANLSPEIQLLIDVNY